MPSSRAIVDPDRQRELEVVAEGVQTPQIQDLLAGLGCATAQGSGVS
jgi:EAL domain-containing protein (putative c-di-GMP-specific phosphodiesterase class I)